MRCDRFVNASLPNMTKNGDSFECWFGNQLYDVVAIGMTLSHSLCLEICFARQLLRNLCNPLMCMEANKFFFQLQAP